MGTWTNQKATPAHAWQRMQLCRLTAAFVMRRPKARHHSLALYMLLRGITLLVRCGNKPEAPKRIRQLLTPTRWRHGDTAIMCACTSQIAYSWICVPTTLPPAFVHFLNKHGGKEMWFYRAARVRISVHAHSKTSPGLYFCKSTRHGSHPNPPGRMHARKVQVAKTWHLSLPPHALRMLLSGICAHAGAGGLDMARGGAEAAGGAQGHR